MSTCKNTNKLGNLNGIDAQLAEILNGYTVESWETRRHSRGTSCLYIRCKAFVPPTKLCLAK